MTHPPPVPPADGQPHLPPAPWWQGAPPQRVLTALGGEARFVGGAVRDALLGRPVGDVDLATPLHPGRVMDLAQAAGLKALPTGIDHGTVTVIADHIPFEVTTLRRDVASHGRHATVAFTDDWAADAARRDLTINALYADGSGRVHDPVGGFADLQTGRVRFIGDARQRMAEDYLRVLRFFRFQAGYGRLPPDTDTLAACAEAADRLDILSVERVWSEVKKLLRLPDPGPALADMHRTGVLRAVLPDSHAPTLPFPAADWVVRLLALHPRSFDPGAILTHLRASLAERKAVLAAAEAERLDYTSPVDWTALRRLGRAAVERGMHLAALNAAPIAPAWVRAVADWTDPPFPIKGADGLALGAAPGPSLGKALAAVERWWEAGGCTADRAACLDRLRHELGGTVA